MCFAVYANEFGNSRPGGQYDRQARRSKTKSKCFDLRTPLRDCPQSRVERESD